MIWIEVMIWFSFLGPLSASLGQFTGEIHNSCFMRLGTNLTEKLGANGSKMSSRRMGSSKMAARPVFNASVQVFNIKLYYCNTQHSTDILHYEIILSTGDFQWVDCQGLCSWPITMESISDKYFQLYTISSIFSTLYKKRCIVCFVLTIVDCQRCSASHTLCNFSTKSVYSPINGIMRPLCSTTSMPLRLCSTTSMPLHAAPWWYWI